MYLDYTHPFYYSFLTTTTPHSSPFSLSTVIIDIEMEDYPGLLGWALNAITYTLVKRREREI
jgi:hypothetical protein